MRMSLTTTLYSMVYVKVAFSFFVGASGVCKGVFFLLCRSIMPSSKVTEANGLFKVEIYYWSNWALLQIAYSMIANTTKRCRRDALLIHGAVMHVTLEELHKPRVKQEISDEESFFPTRGWTCDDQTESDTTKGAGNAMTKRSCSCIFRPTRPFK